MEVTTNIKKSDLIKLNLVIIPRKKGTYITILFISILVASFLIWKKGLPDSGYGWLIITFASISGGIIGTLASMLISVFQILMSSSSENGVLGKHSYRIDQEGLHEKTSANEGISKWEGILDIQTVAGYTFFKITEYQFHIIPHRSFTTRDERRIFEQKALDYWQAKRRG